MLVKTHINHRRSLNIATQGLRGFRLILPIGEYIFNITTNLTKGHSTSDECSDCEDSESCFFALLRS